MAKKKLKVPKRVAGLKIPKQYRKLGAAQWFLNTPLGRNILADVLVAAAGAAAAALAKHRPSEEQITHAGEAVAETGTHAAAATSDLVKTAVGALGSSVAEVARHVLPSGSEKPRKGEGKKASAEPNMDLEEQTSDWSSRH